MNSGKRRPWSTLRPETPLDLRIRVKVTQTFFVRAELIFQQKPCMPDPGQKFPSLGDKIKGIVEYMVVIASAQHIDSKSFMPGKLISGLSAFSGESGRSLNASMITATHNTYL